MKLLGDFFQVRLLWDDNLADIDFSALFLTKDRKILGKDYFVFFNSNCRLSKDFSHLLPCPVNSRDIWNSYPCDPEISLFGSCGCEDEMPDIVPDEYCYEWFKVDVTRIRREISEVIFVASIYDEEYHPQGQMKVQMVENGIVFFDVEYKTCRAVETIKLIRINNDWIVESLGIEHSKGLVDIVELYC